MLGVFFQRPGKNNAAMGRTTQPRVSQIVISDLMLAGSGGCGVDNNDSNML